MHAPVTGKPGLFEAINQVKYPAKEGFLEGLDVTLLICISKSEGLREPLPFVGICCREGAFHESGRLDLVYWT